MQKVAIPTKGEMVDNHFGNCEKFTIYTLSDSKEIQAEENFKSPESCGCKSNLAADLAESGVTVVLAGGMGQGAVNKVKAENIEVFIGSAGKAKEALNKWLNGDKGNWSICPPHEEGAECGH